jgi:hypothetical protein
MSIQRTPMHITPFTIRIPDEGLSDLHTRISNTRWPDPAPGAAWAQGTDLDYLKRLLGYWASGFDWRAQERRLNTFKHFRAELDGIHIHFVHERAHEGNGIPLILTHGWPSSFLELLPLVPLLTNPKANGMTLRHSTSSFPHFRDTVSRNDRHRRAIAPLHECGMDSCTDSDMNDTGPAAEILVRALPRTWPSRIRRPWLASI